MIEPVQIQRLVAEGPLTTQQIVLLSGEPYDHIRNMIGEMKKTGAIVVRSYTHPRESRSLWCAPLWGLPL